MLVTEFHYNCQCQPLPRRCIFSAHPGFPQFCTTIRVPSFWLQALLRLSFLHSHGFSGFDDAQRPTRLPRASFSHCNHACHVSEYYCSKNIANKKIAVAHRCELRPLVISRVMPRKSFPQHLLLSKQRRLNNL